MDRLSIDLYGPGMGPLNRAGLGGLAATLRWIDDNVPAADRPPGSWSVDDRRVELAWGGPAAAGTFFERLYALAFQIRDGLIHLPGAYGEPGPPPWIRAELQQGMALTILQFGPNRKAAGITTRTYEVDEVPMTIEHQVLTGYTHQAAWRYLVTPKGLLRETVVVCGTIAPGFVQRHVAFAETTIALPPGPAMALHFALVGTLALAVDRRTGVLLVPDVEDLGLFAARRGLMNPTQARECRVAGAADAALQALARLRQGQAAEALGIGRGPAVLFATQAWNEKQKARAAVLDVDPGRCDLDRFEVALAGLPPRVVVPRATGKSSRVPQPFWADSVVRPLVAENLARGDRWFRDFRRLVVGPDGACDEDKVRQLGYERRGLRSMIDDHAWEDRGEEALVRAVHDAMRGRFGEIAAETGGNPQAFANRVDRQRQRWRLELAGAKTADDVRDALAAMWSRSAHNPTLRGRWRELLPLLCEEGRWRLNRDLALLALASYEGRGPQEDPAASDAMGEEAVED